MTRSRDGSHINRHNADAVWPPAIDRYSKESIPRIEYYQSKEYSPLTAARKSAMGEYIDHRHVARPEPDYIFCIYLFGV